MKLLKNYLHHLEQTDPLVMAQLGVSSLIAGGTGHEDAQKMLKSFCNEQYQDDPARLERCKTLRYTPNGITYSYASEQRLITSDAPKIAITHKKSGGFEFKPPGVEKKDAYKHHPGRNKQIFKPMKWKHEDAGVQLAMSGGMVTGAIVASLVAWAHKKYMDIYGKANQTCGKMKGSEGKLCRQNYKVQAAKAEIQALKFARSKCGKAKHPKICIQQLNTKVKELMNKYPDIEYTMKSIGKHRKH